MGRDDISQLSSGAFKRKSKRTLGLFIDGVGLDRATRRLDRKVDLKSLVSGLCSGLVPEVARYYTLVPHEDDARQFSFLDAVEKAGLEVVTKRLPPKGVKRQVSMDVHMASDIISYCYGFFSKPTEEAGNGTSVAPAADASPIIKPTKPQISLPNDNLKRLVVVVCPSRELTYAIYIANELKAETSLADFGLYGTSDGWKGVDRWVDLSTSETIWRG